MESPIAGRNGPPDPSADAATLRRYSFPRLGVALNLPGNVWEREADDTAYLARLTRWRTLPGYTTEVSIRRGDAVGQVTTCDEPAGPWESCRVAHATTLRQLEAATRIHSIADHGVGPPYPVRRPTRLDGEKAILISVNAYEYPAHGGQALAYILAVHEGRPWIIRMWTGGNALGGVEEVLSGFRFLDGDAGDVTIPDGWRIYTSEQLGYEVAIPPHWNATEGNALTTFRSNGHVVLLLSLGNRAGLVWVCTRETCEAVRVDGIDDLAANVLPVDPHMGRIPQMTADAVLDGWPARIEAPAPNRLLEGPPANVNVFGILDGRPVVLRFNYSYRMRDIPTAMQSAVIESFALLSD